MGCCTSKNMLKVSSISTSSANNLRSIKDLREQLLIIICNLHNNCLLCADELEACINKHDIQLAIIIKQKKLCIKAMLKNFQQLIEKLDHYSQAVPPKFKEIKKIDDDLKILNELIKKQILFEKDAHLLTKDKSYIDILVSEIHKYDIDQLEIEAEIMQEIEIRESNKEKFPFVRRKYRKTNNIIN